MDRLFVVSVLSILIAKSTSNSCNYKYNLCTDRGISQSSLENDQKCSLESISNGTKYTIILSRNGTESIGILKVNLSLPNSNCEYSVALLVKDSIRNEEECRNYTFQNSEKEIHSRDRTICLTKSAPEATDCKNDDIFIYYTHIYTACYALRFTIEGFDYLISSNKFIQNDYKKQEIEEPVFRCGYDEKKDFNDPDEKSQVTFSLYISILKDIPKMILRLDPLAIDDDDAKDACIYNRKPSEHSWEFNLNNKRTPDYCNKLREVNDTSRENIDCSFPLEVSYNQSYCFTIALIDERCSRHSSWDPPPKDRSLLACSWVLKCERIAAMVAISKRTDVTLPNDETTVYSFVSIGLILVILLMSGLVFSIYRLRLRRRSAHQSYLSANFRDLKAINERVIDTDNESSKTVKRVNSKAIVLMYARGSKPFMTFMSHFRETLKFYCHSHVYDWYAACEWDGVAKVGGYDWAVNLFKKNCRVIWIDTPSARSLITQKINQSLNDIDLKNVNDFRDMCFPAVLDYAKRGVLQLKLQYKQHFIVRLEGLDNKQFSADPFEDLSPHARYLIPYHLSQLCSHLSPNVTDPALLTEETLLREQLMQIKGEAPSPL